ncbi:MAG TPA: hypothetical protein VIU62_23690, partial [Chloroflexota bacterium]
LSISVLSTSSRNAQRSAAKVWFLQLWHDWRTLLLGYRIWRLEGLATEVAPTTEQMVSLRLPAPLRTD